MMMFDFWYDGVEFTMSIAKLIDFLCGSWFWVWCGSLMFAFWVNILIWVLILDSWCDFFDMGPCCTFDMSLDLMLALWVLIWLLKLWILSCLCYGSCFPIWVKVLIWVLIFDMVQIFDMSLDFRYGSNFWVGLSIWVRFAIWVLIGCLHYGSLMLLSICCLRYGSLIDVVFLRCFIVSSWFCFDWIY